MLQQRMRQGFAWLAAGAVLLTGTAYGDPPLPGPTGTVCSTVQCMEVTDVIDNLDGSFDVEFTTYNWFDTTTDDGVNTLLFFTTNLVPKQCLGVNQVDVLGATAPAGWAVVQADNQRVVFEATSSIFRIPDIGLCDPAVLGGCFTGGGCGNDQGGFVLTLRPQIPTGSVCSWAANWRHLDGAGVDNGDVMNFGSVSWTFGSLIEDYSNTPLPPSEFPETGVATCAKLGQKAATKYGLTRMKQISNCLNKINKGAVCDTAKRDAKIATALSKMEEKIDAFCTDDAVANVAWCSTTVAGLKTCLAAQIDEGVDQAIAATYGPQ